MRLQLTNQQLFFNPADPSSSSALTIAGLDISATNVRAALIEVKMNNLKILAQSNVFLTKDADLNEAKLNLAVFQDSCQQAIKLVKEKSKANLQSVVIGFSGNLIKSITHTTKVVRPNPRLPLSEKELDRLLLNNQISALKAATTEVELENQESEVNLQLLNSSLISFKVDGQMIATPINTQAATVEIELYNVFIPQAWLESGQKIAEKLNLNLISLAYKPFALARSLLDSQKDPNFDALIINIEDQSTDIGVIQRSILTHSKNFALGTQIFKSTLSRNLNLNQSAIAGLKNEQGDFDLSQLNQTQQLEAIKVLNQSVSIWLQALRIVLKDLEIDDLPAKIYLSGPGASLKILQVGLRKETWAKMLTFNGQIEIEVLPLSQIIEIEDDLKKGDQSCLTTLAGLGRLASDILNVIENMPQKPKSSLLRSRVSRNKVGNNEPRSN